MSKRSGVRLRISSTTRAPAIPLPITTRRSFAEFMNIAIVMARTMPIRIRTAMLTKPRQDKGLNVDAADRIAQDGLHRCMKSWLGLHRCKNRECGASNVHQYRFVGVSFQF